MHYNHSSLSRVERALDRLGLLKRSCAYIRTATGMDVPGVFDPDFNIWLKKLEKLPAVKPPKRYNKRTLKSMKSKEYKSKPLLVPF